MSGNDKPTIRGTDEGIWRRFRCVPWDESFIGREDRGFKGRLLAEAEGIAAWAVRGAAEWFEHGLNEQERVTRATGEYREESDPFADWVAANFEAAPDGFVPNSEIKQRAERMHPKLPGQAQAWSKDYVRPGDTLCVWKLDRFARPPIDDRHAKGESVSSIAKALGISRATLYRHLEDSES
ncbi:helix-turn-helix domain-containing protein [Kitasatospora sp. NPDC059817]|uniref:helix-turn-helix domain-containing protein n=1 Tax=Kitasatospora sp. NPDC059817 TaxID=3346961 RepID=UPI0036600788